MAISPALLKGLVGLTAVSSVTVVGVLNKDKISGFFKSTKEEKLETSIIKQLFPDCGNSSNSTCNLNETQLKAIKIISKDDETWDTGITIDKGGAEGNEIVTVSWEKSTQENEDFPLGWVFTFKPVDTTKTIKIKKDTKEISINNSGAKLWLKTKNSKHYLSEELNYTKANNKLIEYINKDGYDIVFKVLKEDTGDTILESTYLTFQAATPARKIFIRAVVDTNESNQFKGSENTSTITYLKGLNGNTAWTWECKITLTPEGDINGATKLADEGKLWSTTSGTDDGFFNILQKDSTDSANSSKTEEIKKWKATKIKFIENCASSARESQASRSFGTGNKLSAEQNFQIKKGDTNSDHGSGKQVATSLYFVDKSEFDKWFN